MDRKEAIGIGIIILTVLITMILVSNPISEQRISTLDYVTVGDMWKISEPTQLFALDESQPQGWVTTNGDFICWSEFENIGNTFNVYAYNITDESIVAVANTIDYGEDQQDNYNDEIVWVDERHGQAEIYYKDLSENLTIRVTWTSSSDENSPRIWKDYITYTNGEGDILYYDIVSNTTYTVKEDYCYSPDIHENYIVFERQVTGVYSIWFYDIMTADPPIQISPDGDAVMWAKVFNGTVIWSVFFDSGWTTQMYDVEAESYYTLQPYGTPEEELIIYGSLYGDYMVAEDYHSNPGSSEVALINLDFALFNESVAILTNSSEDAHLPDISATHIGWHVDNTTTGDSDAYFITYSIAEEEVERVFTTETTYNTDWIIITIILFLTLVAFFSYYMSERYHETTGR